MRKLLLIATLLLFTHEAWAVNKYPVIAGGAWQTDATWTLNSDGTANATVAPTASDDVFFNSTSGNVTIGATAVAKSLDCTGYTGTLTQNSTATISGSVTLVSGMTFTYTSGTLVMSTTGTLTTGGKLIGPLTLSSGTVTLADNLSFFAAKTINFVVTAALDMNGKTVAGNSSTNRVIIRSGTLGTSSGVITLNGGTFSNADFRDVQLSASTDLSAITGLSGDCGGNTNITFTTAATQTYTGGTDSWSTAARWTSRVPLPQDDVVITGQSGAYTVTGDMRSLGKSIDWSSALGTPTFNNNTIATTSYGSLTLVSTMVSSGGSGHTFEGRGSFTLDTRGIALTTGQGTTIAMVGGTLTLLSAVNFNNLVSNSVSLTNGTLNTNGFTVTSGTFSASNATTRTLTLGATTWNLARSGGAASHWDLSTTTNLTFNAGTSTIVHTQVGATAYTFAGGGLTYNNLSISGGGAGAVIITGSNSFYDIYMNPSVGGTKSLQITSGTTQTIRGGSNGFRNQNYLWTLTETSGTDPIFLMSGGPFRGDYLSLTAIDCSLSGAKCYAGPLTHSTDGGGNTNWIFSAAPNQTFEGTFIGDEEQLVYKA